MIYQNIKCGLELLHHHTSIQDEHILTTHLSNILSIHKTNVIISITIQYDYERYTIGPAVRISSIVQHLVSLLCTRI